MPIKNVAYIWCYFMEISEMSIDFLAVNKHSEVNTVWEIRPMVCRLGLHNMTTNAIHSGHWIQNMGGSVWKHCQLNLLAQTIYAARKVHSTQWADPLYPEEHKTIPSSQLRHTVEQYSCSKHHPALSSDKINTVLLLPHITMLSLASYSMSVTNTPRTD